MKRFKIFIAALAVTAFGVAAFIPPVPSFAIDPLAICNDPANAQNEVCKSQQNNTEDAYSLVTRLVNTLLFLVGALAVIMIIWGGITFITSTGDSGKVTRAKNTIMYSVIGLVIALIAYAIVNWVVKLFIHTP